MQAAGLYQRSEAARVPTARCAGSPQHLLLGVCCGEAAAERHVDSAGVAIRDGLRARWDQPRSCQQREGAEAAGDDTPLHTSDTPAHTVSDDEDEHELHRLLHPQARLTPHHGRCDRRG